VKQWYVSKTNQYKIDTKWRRNVGVTFAVDSDKFMDIILNVETIIE
jgi:hypothetical protein